MAGLHGVRTNASTSPEIGIAAVASRTSNLRVGSGAVLFNHRSPYRVAETFVQLNAMFPGRIDLGLGRATAGPLIDFALQRSRTAVAADEPYEDKVAELLQWFDGFDDDHPFAKVPFFEGVAGRPEPWILGSSRSWRSSGASSRTAIHRAGLRPSRARGPCLRSMCFRWRTLPLPIT
jgi:alkanesulfonate monooxygenase SsuD/methylene tetrahydromethanopterin reductase-like flavin-dependent oxidoreductase (luciferase family)